MSLAKLVSNKTVFVFGAGFSKSAGFPLQYQILERIFEFDVPRNFMIEDFELLNSLPAFYEARTKLQSFIRDIFTDNPKHLPTLEDLFTILDFTIAEKGYCKGYSWRELVDIDEALKRLILFIFHISSTRIGVQEAKFYSDLSGEMIKLRSLYPKKKFSIVSANWDTLIEDKIFDSLAKKKKKYDVDYCCYTTPLTPQTPHIPSLLQKALSINNIKFIKLHGSTNWLLCPSCKRIYTGLGSKESVWSMYATTSFCEKCTKDQGIKKPVLQPFFITPTYLKVFPNSHIQSVWHNAHIELSEADRVIFLGYSLPEADFHLRALLKKSINYNIPIDVVLWKTDKRTRSNKNSPQKRYEDFFSRNSLNFHFEGVEAFFSKL